MGKTLEQWHPLLCGVAASGIYVAFLRKFDLPPTTKDILSAVIGMAAIAVGFLATAKSILLSIDMRRSVRLLKDAGVYGTLVDFILAAINWSFALAGLSVVALAIDFSMHAQWHVGFIAFWIFVLVTATASYYRVIRIFSAILKAKE